MKHDYKGTYTITINQLFPSSDESLSNNIEIFCFRESIVVEVVSYILVDII